MKWAKTMSLTIKTFTILNYFEKFKSKAIFNRNIIFEMGQRNRIHALKYPHQNRLNEKRVVCRKNIHFYAAAHLHLK